MASADWLILTRSTIWKLDRDRQNPSKKLKILAPIGFCLRERTRDLGRTCLGGSASLQSHSNLISLTSPRSPQMANGEIFCYCLLTCCSRMVAILSICLLRLNRDLLPLLCRSFFWLPCKYIHTGLLMYTYGFIDFYKSLLNTKLVFDPRSRVSTTYLFAYG